MVVPDGRRGGILEIRARRRGPVRGLGETSSESDAGLGRATLPRERRPARRRGDVDVDVVGRRDEEVLLEAARRVFERRPAADEQDAAPERPPEVRGGPVNRGLGEAREARRVAATPRSFAAAGEERFDERAAVRRGQLRAAIGRGRRGRRLGPRDGAELALGGLAGGDGGGARPRRQAG